MLDIGPVLTILPLYYCKTELLLLIAFTLNSVLNVKALGGAFNQEKALVGAFSMIVQPVVELMDRFTALLFSQIFPYQSYGAH